MPTVCGEPLRFSNKALTPCASLQPANSYSTHSNIKPAPLKSSLGQRHGLELRKTPTSTLTTLTQGYTLAKLSSAPMPQGPPVVQQSLQSQLVPSLDTSHPQPIRNTQPNAHVVPNFASSSQTSNSQQNTVPIVPIFKPKVPAKASSCNSQVGSQLQKPCAPIVPTFKSKTTKGKAPVASTVPASKVTTPGTKVMATKGAKLAAKNSLPQQVPEAPLAKRPCLAPTSTIPRLKPALPANPSMQPTTSQNINSRNERPATLQNTNSLNEQQVVPDLSRSLVDEELGSFTEAAGSSSIAASKPMQDGSTKQMQKKKPTNNSAGTEVYAANYSCNRYDNNV